MEYWVDPLLALLYGSRVLPREDAIRVAETLLVMVKPDQASQNETNELANALVHELQRKLRITEHENKILRTDVDMYRGMWGHIKAEMERLPNPYSPIRDGLLSISSRSETYTPAVSSPPPLPSPPRTTAPSLDDKAFTLIGDDVRELWEILRCSSCASHSLASSSVGGVLVHRSKELMQQLESCTESLVQAISAAPVAAVGVHALQCGRMLSPESVEVGCLILDLLTDCPQAALVGGAVVCGSAPASGITLRLDALVRAGVHIQLGWYQCPCPMDTNAYTMPPSLWLLCRAFGVQVAFADGHVQAIHGAPPDVYELAGVLVTTRPPPLHTMLGFLRHSAPEGWALRAEELLDKLAQWGVRL